MTRGTTSQRRARAVAALLLAVVVAGCGGRGAEVRSDHAGPSARFVYDCAGRLAAVQEGGTTAVLRYEAAGDRVVVDHVRSRGYAPDRPHVMGAPRVTGVTPERVSPGATITVSGRGFDAVPAGNVVAVGGALGRVLSAAPTELRVQLPPVAAPGPVTVSTAHVRSTSRDDLVVVPAEVRPAEVTDVIRSELGRTTTLRGSQDEVSPRRTLLTFRGAAGAVVELHLGPGKELCASDAVGLAGPTGTIIEASAGSDSWCGRPARLPMAGTYTATVTHSSELRATLVEKRAAAPRRLPGAAATRRVPQGWDEPAEDGPADFPVDLSSGLLRTQVTDLPLGGSGAADLTRTFAVGDQDLPALAPEEPLARHWSVGASLALQPSASYSYLDVVLPDGLRLPYRRVSEGAPEATGGVFEPGVGAGPFAGSQVTYAGSGWELRTRAGMVLGFARTGSPLRLSWIRDPEGRTARFVRGPDDQGRPVGDLVGVVSEDGQWARLDHDAEHRITGATDQVGDVVTYRYVRAGDHLAAASYRPVGGTVTTVGYRYQELTGRLVAVTDGRRELIRFGYDEAGRVVRQVVARSPGVPAGEWRYSYSVGTRRVTLPGRTDRVSLPQVRRVVVVGPAGRRTVRFAGGRWVSDSTAAGTTRVVRQPGTDLVSPGSSSRDPDLETAAGLPEGYLELRDSASAVFVDAKGRRAAMRSPGGAVTRVAYDAYDRPVAITDADDTSTRLTYTDAGDIATVTDAAGTTRYGRDDRGQQVSETDPLGRRQRWRYDGAGHVTWQQDQRGVVSTFGYDRFGRLVTARYGVRRGRAPAERVDHVFDRSGRLAQVRDSTAEGPVSFRYDSRGNVVAETSAGDTVLRRYDDAGRPTDVILPGGAGVGPDYSAEGRLAGLVLRDRSRSVRAAPRYDRRGRLAGLDLPGGVRCRLGYSRGQLTGLSYTSGGRRVAEQRASYDAAGRLSGLDGDLGRPALPREQAERAFDAAHQVTAGAGGTHAWRWDRAGNLVEDDTHRYTWDARGRLVVVAAPRVGRASATTRWAGVRVPPPRDRPRATSTTATTSSSTSPPTATARPISAARMAPRWRAPRTRDELQRRTCPTSSATSPPRSAPTARSRVSPTTRSG
ncbi:MAG: hypothetical protein JWR90_2511 [Marmoricola sp.]|jgi:YD repeat-containing protein|nr:hypothetical protein [Marmoricola sp.]